jgi:uncharacterized protein (DUF1778 family)
MSHGGYREGCGRKKSINPRRATVYAKVTVDEKALFEELAKLAGLSLSDWVRDKLKKNVKI